MPTEQEYITSLSKPEKAFVPSSAPMEVHLTKELSNPHSRAKKQARWQARQTRKVELLDELIKAEYANLAGRKRRDARAEAVWKWQKQLDDEQRTERLQRWRKRGAEARLERRTRRKARKAARREEKLRTLVLPEAPNQVLPTSSKAPTRSG